MTASPALGEIFRMLQAADPAAALEGSRRLLEADPGNARAHLAAGLALRMLGRLDDSRAALERSSQLDPDDYAAAYENGVTLEMLKRREEALACFERSLALRPHFAPAHTAIGMQAFARGDWPRAVERLAAAASIDPANPSVMTNLGLALAEAGNFERAMATLRQAVVAFPQFVPAHHALGWTLHKAKKTAEAVESLRHAVAVHPDPRWRLDLAKALEDLGQHDEARALYEAVIDAAPAEKLAFVTFGRFCVAHGDFARAAELFRAAAALDEADIELPMYIAQVELARGRWREGWEAYARREQRLRYESEAARAGRPYRLPARETLRGKRILVTGEQGLGDEIFFLRFAARLREMGARLAYVGEARLKPLFERSGLFESVFAFGEKTPTDALPLLSGDLPLVLASEDTPSSVRIEPDPAHLEAMRRRLEQAGPRPWIGVTWRAGTARNVVAHALHKEAPIAGLFAALPRDGTVVSLQRDAHFEELESASHALGRALFDFSAVNDDLDEALAIVALLDRHVGVSNTNMHLAAAAGACADVLVPFPPEWRWGLAGDSAWFPGFRVFRQLPDGDWSRAYAALASVAAGSTSRG